MGSNSQTLPILLLVACCCCSSSASGAGAYFLGYIPGNDKYYIRIFQLEKMFQILEDIKNDMVYEGTAPNQYTGKINGTDFCDEVKDFKENLDEKREDEIEKVTDDDFKKLVEKYMKDNEIKGYTYRQAINVIDFLYVSCGTGDKRVFKKTVDFTAKLTKLFDLKTPPTENTWTAQTGFCDDVTIGDVTTKGFRGLHKEITDVTAVSSLAQVWDGATGTMGVSGFNLTDLISSVDYCTNTFDKTCGEIGGGPSGLNFTEAKAACGVAAGCTWTAGSDSTDTSPTGSCGDSSCNEFMEEGVCPTTRCVWTAGADSTDALPTGLCGDPCSTFQTSIDCIDTRCQWTAGADSTVTSPTGSCGVIPACSTFTTNASTPSVASDCPTRCEWTAGSDSTDALPTGSCGDTIVGAQ